MKGERRKGIAASAANFIEAVSQNLSLVHAFCEGRPS